jgi:hypothetical protein
MATRPPLLVHLIFHPESAETRALAAHIHRALNDDPALSGLRVPTVLAVEDGRGQPPERHDLDEAEHSVVIVFADDHMLIEPTDGGTSRTWPEFVADLWQRCQSGRHRFIPVQVTKAAWPLDERLRTTNFVRAVQEPDSERAAWLARVVVVELCCFLAGEERGQKLPVELFLSHAKQDIETAPAVFKEIVAHLEATQPVKAWIDSAKIEAGSNFAEKIEQGVRDSIVLVLATDSYGARPWCRKELLLAKRYQRPFVIIEALEDLDPRSFPYAGNAPRLRWSAGSARRAVDLVLKETLRHLHVRRVLERQRQDGDVILTAPPELATIIRLPKDSSVLYPDPPLGDEESEELAPLGLRIETPLQRAAKGRALTGRRIVLSISESGDTERHGLTKAHLDAALCEISRQLLVRGACLEYGGHLGPGGYTLALFDMVRAYSASSGLPAAERIINDVGWPQPLGTLPVSVRAEHQAVARYRRIPRPEGVAFLEPATFVEEPAFFQPDTGERRYAWARGMTAMREAQAGSASARVVLGGKVGSTPAGPDGTSGVKWYWGRIPGVVEEALASVKAGQPLYLIGAFGGAAALAIDLLEGRQRPEFTWGYQREAPHSDAMRALYEQYGPPWEDYDEMAARFAMTGVAGLAAKNGLSVEQNRELFTSRDIPRIVELLLDGLTELPA